MGLAAFCALILVLALNLPRADSRYLQTPIVKQSRVQARLPNRQAEFPDQLGPISTIGVPKSCTTYLPCIIEFHTAAKNTEQELGTYTGRVGNVRVSLFRIRPTAQKTDYVYMGDIARDFELQPGLEYSIEFEIPFRAEGLHFVVFSKATIGGPVNIARSLSFPVEQIRYVAPMHELDDPRDILRIDSFAAKLDPTLLSFYEQSTILVEWIEKIQLMLDGYPYTGPTIGKHLAPMYKSLSLWIGRSNVAATRFFAQIAYSIYEENITFFVDYLLLRGKTLAPSMFTKFAHLKRQDLVPDRKFVREKFPPEKTIDYVQKKMSKAIELICGKFELGMRAELNEKRDFEDQVVISTQLFKTVVDFKTDLVVFADYKENPGRILYLLGAE